MRLYRTQRGDTIMEVLICVAVLSFVLSAAFALANRSTKASLQAGERGESTRVTESQVELLKTFISQTASPALPPDSFFCIYSDGSTSPPTLKTKDVPATTVNNDDFDSFPGECKRGQFYNTYIEKAGNVYTAYTKWPAASGRGIDKASFVYRVYPDLASAPTGVTVIGGCNAPSEYMNSIGGCVPCAPGFQNLLGPFSMTPCTPVPPIITVRVNKILSPDGINSPGCGGAQTSASGVGVRLSQGATQYNQTSTATFTNLLFNTTYGATIPSMPANFAGCVTSQNQTTQGQGSYPASNHTLTLVIRAVCYDVPTPTTVQVPDAPYPDVIGWNNYYTIGGRNGGLDTYANAGYANSFQYYPLPGDIGPQVTTSTGHIHVPTGGSGVKYFSGYIASAHHPGKGFYAVWDADYHSDPIYGPAYSHGTHPETVIVNVRTCPT